jgi:hypothetical protein
MDLLILISVIPSVNIIKANYVESKKIKNGNKVLLTILI